MRYIHSLRGRLATASLSTMLVATCFVQQARADQTTYVIQPNDTLSAIASRFGTTVPALMAANNISNSSFIVAGQSLVISSAASTPAQSTTLSAANPSTTFYVVKWGDSLSAIGQQFSVGIPALASANSLADPYVIRAGQQLVIPSSSDSPAQSAAQFVSASATTPNTAPVTGGQMYAVQQGDTLSAIGSRFGVTADAIAAANHTSIDSILSIGQQLAIPTSGTSSAATDAAPTVTAASATTAAPRGSYVVQAGDTLSAIGARYGLTIAALAAQNNISADSIISVGQQLTVPASQGQASQEPAVDKSTIAGILTSEAQAAGVDVGLVKALAWQESGWQMVTASDGGMGVMQLMPDSVDWAGGTLLGSTINPYDPTQNIRAGVAMLRYYLHVYGDVPHALAAYHQGMASLDNEGYHQDTTGYIANIEALQQQFGG
jgi:LysM repeat protein